MLLSQEVERIGKGEPVCLEAIASAWAERRISVGLANWMEIHVLRNNLARELQIAIRNKQLCLFDMFRKKERRYRSDDEPDLAKLRVWLLPLSVDTWLTKEGLEPALSANAVGVAVAVEQETTRAVPGPLRLAEASSMADGTRASPKMPFQRSAAQDEAILAGIRARGYDPKSLPKNPPGKSGVKASIRSELVGKNALFQKEGYQFKKAWERLRERGEIADAFSLVDRPDAEIRTQDIR